MTIADDALAILRAVRDNEEFHATERGYLLSGFMIGRGYLKLAEPTEPGAVQITNVYFVAMTAKGLEAIEHPDTLDLSGYGGAP